MNVGWVFQIFVTCMLAVADDNFFVLMRGFVKARNVYNVLLSCIFSAFKKCLILMCFYDWDELRLSIWKHYRTLQKRFPRISLCNWNFLLPCKLMINTLYFIFHKKRSLESLINVYQLHFVWNNVTWYKSTRD